jgi:decaprenylphospho-beta-D-ribofuranose 2-oxidase
VIHDANYLASDEDPIGPSSLRIEQQILPSSVLGVPKSLLPRLLRPFVNNLGVRAINAAKHYASRFGRQGEPFFQSHVGSAFLLDYIPGWELAYGPGGLVQVQAFARASAAQQVFREVIARSQAHGLPAYLGVMKRHRPELVLDQGGKFYVATDSVMSEADVQRACGVDVLERFSHSRRVSIRTPFWKAS